MAHTLQQVNSQAIRVFMGTLTDGEELHAALARMASAENIHAATFDLLGGLTEVTLGEYDFVTHTRREPLHFSRPLEILSGHGTISRLDGAPHVHTHLTLAFRDPGTPHGIAIIGGHATHAVAFAVEFTLTVYDGVPVNRALHAETGLRLWNLTQRV